MARRATQASEFTFVRRARSLDTSCYSYGRFGGESEGSLCGGSTTCARLERRRQIRALTLVPALHKSNGQCNK